MSPSDETETGPDAGTRIGADSDVGRSLLTYGLLAALLLSSGLYYAFVV